MFKIIAIAAFFCGAFGYRTMTDEFGTKIVGGVPVHIYQHPYQISLMKNRRHQCGGSIISEFYVVTASHCTYGLPPRALSIRAGSSSSKYGGQIRDVAEIHQHQKFDYATFDYDIAVLKLSKSLQLGETVEPIDMPSLNQIIPVGTMAVATGWGSIKESGGAPAQLQKVLIPLISDEECQNKYTIVGQIEKQNLIITPRMICGGYSKGQMDTCQGNF